MLFEKIKLENDEQVLLTVRKHWFVITLELLSVAITALLPFLLLFGLSYLERAAAVTALDTSLSGTLIIYALSAWLLLSTFGGFAIWTHYYLDLWIVTDRRIISVDQVHFFNRNVAIFRLERLQDIEYRIQGIIPTFLNFGSISAQTAGTHEHNFRATGMPDPQGLQAKIQTAMDERLKTLHINPNLME